MAVAFDREIPESRFKCENAIDILLVDDCFETGELPTNELAAHAAKEHHTRGLGIDPDVEFRCRSNVSFTTRRATHHHTTRDFLSDARLSG